MKKILAAAAFSSSVLAGCERIDVFDPNELVHHEDLSMGYEVKHQEAGVRVLVLKGDTRESVQRCVDRFVEALHTLNYDFASRVNLICASPQSEDHGLEGLGGIQYNVYHRLLGTNIHSNTPHVEVIPENEEDYYKLSYSPHLHELCHVVDEAEGLPSLKHLSLFAEGPFVGDQASKSDTLERKAGEEFADYCAAFRSDLESLDSSDPKFKIMEGLFDS